MKFHFGAAQEYVLGLGRDQVTGRQKSLLKAIADYYDPRYGSANVSLETLCADTLIERRNMRRMFEALAPLLEYVPGGGQGNYGQFRFPQMPLETGVQRGLNGGTKGVILPPAIRKENLNPNLKPDGVDFEVSPSRPSHEQFPSPSSSGNDDGVEINRALSQVVAAYEDSPVTTGKAMPADLITARKLLQHYTATVIVYGILLGSCRKSASILNAATEPHYEQYFDELVAGNRVHSLAYFVDAILEAHGDPNMSESYARYMQHSLARFRQQLCDKKKPQAASA